mmetsp:Transcript_1886/g.4207  ORF Transcript_1886/g.4207 Transcript_1886/m.4207 type:complete len:86 (-) Transcript_1886:1767-2024(-)
MFFVNVVTLRSLALQQLVHAYETVFNDNAEATTTTTWNLMEGMKTHVLHPKTCLRCMDMCFTYHASLAAVLVRYKTWRCCLFMFK